MTRQSLIAPIAAAVLAVAHPHAQSGDPLSPLRFLVGDWTAIESPAGERGSFTFKPGVQDHVLVRTNEAVYDATPQHAASRHDDLMVIYSENGSIKAEYFDNEGHVIRYAVRSDRPDHAVFVSEPSARDPQFRLTYALASDGVLAGSFEIAAPGSPGAFKPYLSWKARRTK